MTYAPPPYVPPVTTEDPTAVMGRRISAALLDLLLPTAIAIAVGFVLWFGAGTRYPRPLNESGIQQSCGESSVAIGEECATVNNDFVIVSSEDGSRARTVGFLIWLYVPLNVLLVQGVSGATVGKHLVGLRVVRGTAAMPGSGETLFVGCSCWWRWRCVASA